MSKTALAQDVILVGPVTTGAWQMPAAEPGMDARWLDAYFASQLANVTALHIYGVPLLKLKPTIRADIRSYAESFTEDAVQRYSSILNAVEEAR